MANIRSVSFIPDQTSGVMVPVIGEWRECRHVRFDSEKTIEASRLTFKAVCVECGATFHGDEARKIMERGS